MPAVSVLSWPGALPRRPLEVERGRSVDRVEALIGRLAPAAICDECIVDKLGLKALHQASHRTRALAGTTGYESSRDECAICGEPKPIIRRTGHCSKRKKRSKSEGGRVGKEGVWTGK